jgi:1-acyl-sn-glycerol-3-phosphate acyltransferase
VRIGKPFELAARDAAGKRHDLGALTDEMMIEIAKLLPEEYRGIYTERLRMLETDSSAGLTTAAND